MNHMDMTKPPGPGQPIVALALLGLTLLLMPVAAIQAQPATEVELDQVLEGMSSTVDLQNAGDDRLFAVGQTGLIQIVSFDAGGDAILLPTPFLDINHHFEEEVK